MTEKIPSPRGYPLVSSFQSMKPLHSTDCAVTFKDGVTNNQRITAITKLRAQIGNILELDPSNPLASLSRLAGIHGPLMRLYTPREVLFASSYCVAKDLCDEQRFEKSIVGPLQELRVLGGDGLFTAYNHEHNWELAHRLLMPAFGPLPIKSMFPGIPDPLAKDYRTQLIWPLHIEMQDIVSQMVLKWARFGPDHTINVPDDFTRLTLDSIAICAMGDRFNSFYQEEQHPFVHAMLGVLGTALNKLRRLPLPSRFYSAQDKAFDADSEICLITARDLLAARRARPNDKKDLLNAMINAKDPKTGEKLSDDNIIRNMVTFLVAGHETTSGLLSFLFYCLLENPRVYSKLQEEIDTVVGKATVTFEHMSKLPYLEACLRETLRLYPTAPALTLTAKGDQIVADGRYLIKDGENILLLLDKLHRDPEVYGPDVEAFRPERMYKEAFHALPPNAWKPFGNGTRACIGRPFAWQEAILATATLLQTFHFTKADPAYRLTIAMTLTIKPKNFFMKAKLRDPHFVEHAGIVGGGAAESKTSEKRESREWKADDKAKLLPMKILYGSNTGTCEALAQSLASSAPGYGFEATVSSLDDGVSQLSKHVPVVIFTASYEGLPPDNAGHFVEWISSSKKAELEGVAFAVFGVGNKEWVHTYQKVPMLVEEALAKNGGKPLVDREETDVQGDQIFNKFDDWQENKLWPALKNQFGSHTSGDAGSAKALSMTIDVQSRSSLLHQDTQLGEVAETLLLTVPGMSRKRHIGIRLPSGVTYRAGDYLAVLPLNPPSLVKRVQKRFGLPWDAMITIDASNVTSLPKGHPVSAHDILASMVELEQPVSSRVATAVAKSIPDADEARALEERLAKGISVPLLELLEDHPQAQFSLAQFLAALPPMRMRQYSISSSPLQDPTIAALTYSVLDAPNRSGSSQNFVGICTTYMERLSVGDRVHVSLKSSRAGFHLPSDDSKAIIMACAGTGLAPFRAFVAERAIKKANGANVGPAVLFYGCKQPEGDDLYREEFDAWEKQGVVSVRRAFSSKPGDADAGGARRVQDRIWNDREEVAALYREDAQLYLCGAGTVGAGVEEVMARIRAEAMGEDLATAKKWVAELKGERYWSDVSN